MLEMICASIIMPSFLVVFFFVRGPGKLLYSDGEEGVCMCVCVCVS